MDNLYRINPYWNKIADLSYEDQLKTVYMWIKQDHISLSDFKLLVRIIERNAE